MAILNSGCILFYGCQGFLIGDFFMVKCLFSLNAVFVWFGTFVLDNCKELLG
jgi:hypothetical protein